MTQLFEEIEEEELSGLEQDLCIPRIIARDYLFL